MAYGTMGGDGQPQTQAMLFARHVLHGMALDRALDAIPGVLETGLFIGVADEVILAGPAGIERIA